MPNITNSVWMRLICCAMAIAALACNVMATRVGPLTSARPYADPSPDQVMTESVKAMGGKEAIEKIMTLRSVMEMMVPGPNAEIKVQIESLWSRDGGRIVRTSTPMGAQELGTDGKVSWKKSPMGTGPLSQDEAEQLKNKSSMIMHLLEPEIMKQEITKIENAGTLIFDGRDCHRLHFIKKNGEEGDMFYDVTSGLPAGIDKSAAPKTHIVWSDWQTEQGVKFYRTMIVESSDQPTPITMKVTKIEVNTLDASAFAPPSGAKDAATSKPDGPTPTAGSSKEIALDDLTPEQQQKAQQTIESMKKSGDAGRMKQAISQLEPMIGSLPEEQQKMLQYVVQEMKKEIARLGG